jgi:hypothetical protein
MEIDHIFMFVERDGPELAQLKGLGLVETYRREHPGQGTANVCFCFDNMFVELLWMDDPVASLTDPFVRTGLEPRSRWHTAATCPFGIAWRGDAIGAIKTWDFAPPYLPNGVTINVATDSDDPRQPMMFTFPGSTAPSTWDLERRRNLQRAGDFDVIAEVIMTLPQDVEPSATLLYLEQFCDTALQIVRGAAYALEIVMSGSKRQQRFRLL